MSSDESKKLMAKAENQQQLCKAIKAVDKLMRNLERCNSTAYVHIKAVDAIGNDEVRIGVQWGKFQKAQETELAELLTAWRKRYIDELKISVNEIADVGKETVSNE